MKIIQKNTSKIESTTAVSFFFRNVPPGIRFGTQNGLEFTTEITKIDLLGIAVAKGSPELRAPAPNYPKEGFSKTNIMLTIILH